MSSISATATAYVLGHSIHEQERLMLQARILRPYTDRFFRAAGLASGMRVLDLGSGMGDVSFLAGDIVGPGGCVLGIDRDPAAVARARQRAQEQGCSSWVLFEQACLDDFAANEQFDAVVGRCVLLYQPDAAATLRRMVQFVRPGGIVALHEMDFSFTNSSYPVCALWDSCCRVIASAFELSKLPVDFGRRLAKTFVDAGLPYPDLAAEIPIGGGRHSYLFPWIVSTVMSLAPRFEALGLTLPEGIVADETLAARIEAEAVALHCQISAPPQFGAWTRKPSDERVGHKPSFSIRTRRSA